MATIKKVYADVEKTTQLYPQTHERAVVDDNGTTLESKLGAVTDLVNQKQMEVGAVPIDIVPTEGHTTHLVSSDGIAAAIAGVNLIKDNSSIADFEISDADGYILARFADGHIFTKNFSSAPLRGKKVSFLGDSITTFANYTGSYNSYYTGSNAGITSVSQTWWKGLCDEQGATVNRLYAYGGKEVVNFLCTKYDQLFSNGTSGDAPDVIFVFAGTNDWYQGRTLGTIDDPINSNGTFYAGYKYLLKNLKDTYPYATVICITLLNSMTMGTTVPYLNGNGVSKRAFCDAIIDCCKYYSVQHIDMNCMFDLNGGNYTTYLNDNTHPNRTGASVFKRAVSKALLTLNII